MYQLPFHPDIEKSAREGLQGLLAYFNFDPFLLDVLHEPVVGRVKGTLRTTRFH